VKAFPIIRVISKLLIPYILLFGFYVQFHGDYGPGGGFQAGVILASALILYGLVFGLDAVKRVAPPSVIERGVAAVGRSPASRRGSSVTAKVPSAAQL
jgi:multicomponent Na+:H+ antiporter subunit B